MKLTNSITALAILCFVFMLGYTVRDTQLPQHDWQTVEYEFGRIGAKAWRLDDGQVQIVTCWEPRQREVVSRCRDWTVPDQIDPEGALQLEQPE